MSGVDAGRLCWKVLSLYGDRWVIDKNLTVCLLDWRIIMSTLKRGHGLQLVRWLSEFVPNRQWIRLSLPL